jgi:hypothetical protein
VSPRAAATTHEALHAAAATAAAAAADALGSTTPTTSFGWRSCQK